MDVEYYACYVGVKCTRFQFNWKIRSIKCYGDNDASKLLCQLSNASQHTVSVDGIYQTEAWIAESQTRKTDKSYHHERATQKKRTSWLMKRYSCNGWYAWWKLAVEKSGNFFFLLFYWSTDFIHWQRNDMWVYSKEMRQSLEPLWICLNFANKPTYR